jgi:hypothetical protein
MSRVHEKELVRAYNQKDDCLFRRALNSLLAENKKLRLAARGCCTKCGKNVSADNTDLLCVECEAKC